MIDEAFVERIAADMADQAQRPGRSVESADTWDVLTEAQRRTWREYAEVVVARVCSKRFGDRDGLEAALIIALGVAAQLMTSMRLTGGTAPTNDELARVMADYLTAEGYTTDDGIVVDRATAWLRDLIAMKGQGAHASAAAMLDLLDIEKPDQRSPIDRDMDPFPPVTSARIPAPDHSVFETGSMQRLVGTETVLDIGSERYTATITAVEVVQDGRALDVTFSVPDGTPKRVNLAVADMFSRTFSDVSFGLGMPAIPGVPRRLS